MAMQMSDQRTNAPRNPATRAPCVNPSVALQGRVLQFYVVKMSLGQFEARLEYFVTKLLVFRLSRQKLKRMSWQPWVISLSVSSECIVSGVHGYMPARH